MYGEGQTGLNLSLAGVGRRFGERKVLTGINATVDSGGVLVVAGPNGSGKSTLLRIIAGLLPASVGTVQITANGTVVDSSHRNRMLGYVAPDLMLYRELTGTENLRFFARLRGMELARPELAELLEKVGLKGRGRDLVGSYSSGMRQRLKYAFALMHAPRLLLLDEPTANLDSDGAAIAETIVRDQRRRGITVVATNDARETAWGDSVVQLGAGQDG